MPSGKTHDAITFFLAPPIFAAAWKLTENVPLATIVTVAFLFGGLMFGPDLDTMSKQYTRWSFFRYLWYPYQAFFPHRSRWSHGLVFGTFLRIVYFMGALTLTSFILTFIYAAFRGANEVSLLEFMKAWRLIGDFLRANTGKYTFLSVFIGLWLGAASHTLTDIAGSFVKTGKVSEFL
ncbi:MAG: metal-binding protein [Acidobacteriota bacterium]|nr:metal-binding protein [Acidobacteriota bacterium]